MVALSPGCLPGSAGVDDLTLDQIDELRADLEALRTELERALASSEQGARPVEVDAPIGRVSRMDAIQQQSMTKANREAAKLRLKQVEAALERCERGAYGACLECEESVGFQRLKARPEAVLCIACQSQREQRG